MGGSVGGAVGNVVGGILGKDAAAGDIGEARNQKIIANQILQEVQAAPDISKPLILEKYKSAGVLTPEMEQYISAGPSAMQGINSDQQSLDAQRQALHQMQQRSVGGLTSADRAALNQANLATQGDTQSKIQQILQQQQARTGGAGMQGNTLAAQLQAAQSGANREAGNSNAIAQLAAQNALQATSLTGQLGGQLNQQQFGQQSQKAQAADQMNRFNIQNQIGQQQRNVGTSNQAQASNLANAQNIGNMNTQQQNQELQNQLQREAQQWQMNLNRAGLQSGATNQLGSYLQGQGEKTAQGTQNMWAGIGGLAGTAAGAGMGGGASKPTMMAGESTADVSNIGYDGGRIPQDLKQVPNYKQGGQVPGQAHVPGDSPANDTVHARLSPGEIVVPRSLAESKIGKEMLKLIHAHNAVKNKMNGHD